MSLSKFLTSFFSSRSMLFIFIFRLFFSWWGLLRFDAVLFNTRKFLGHEIRSEMLSLFCFPVQAMSHHPTELSKGAVCLTEVILEGKKFCTESPGQSLAKGERFICCGCSLCRKRKSYQSGSTALLIYLNVESSFDWQLLISCNI